LSENEMNLIEVANCNRKQKQVTRESPAR
jgi:hypothetical protein